MTGRLAEVSINAKNFRGFYTINSYILNWDRDCTAFFIKHSERTQVPLDGRCLISALTTISPLQTPTVLGVLPHSIISQSKTWNNTGPATFKNVLISMSTSGMLPRKSCKICKITLCFWGKGRRNEKRLLRLSFKAGGGPLLALSNPEKIKMTGDEMNMHGWFCVALIRASPALLAAPPGLTPCIPFLPRGSTQPLGAACSVRRSVRRKEQNQNHSHRGFGFWKPPGTALAAGCEHTAVFIPLQRLSPLSPTVWREEAQRDLQNKVMVSAARQCPQT